MREIPLTQGKVMQVDDEEFEFFNLWKWCAKFHHGNWYAQRGIRTFDGRWTTICAHQLLMIGAKADHIDGDGLNNQKENLRPASNLQNSHNTRKSTRNTSGFKGVSLRRRNGKWIANIQLEGKLFFLGEFSFKEEAARAYDAAAKQHFGEFARLNFPD